jgi:hypothetical protein
MRNDEIVASGDRGLFNLVLANRTAVSSIRATPDSALCLA